MSDTRQKILSLPDLTLSSEEWSELAAIMSSLEDKSLESLKKYLNESKTITIINPKKIPDILKFVAAWLDLTQAILVWMQQLNTTWASIIKKNMTADNLIPLIMALLPTDIIQLNLIYEKLERAALMGDTGARGCYLTNLSIATYSKILDLKENKSTTENDILIVANEIIKSEQIAKLIPVCMNYKEYLRDTFILLFQTSDHAAYQHYAGLCGDKDDKNTLLDTIIEHLSIGNLILKTPDLTALLEKFFVLYEMHITLQRGGRASDKLIEFSAKFIQHQEILTSNPDSSGRTFLKKTHANLGINRVYEYMGWEDAETQFLKMAGLFSHQVQAEANDQQNSSESSRPHP